MNLRSRLALAATAVIAPVLTFSATTGTATQAVAAESASSVAAKTVAAPKWANPAKGKVAAKFGYVTHPLTGTKRLHDGTDIAAKRGTAVRAAAAGTAKVTKSDWAGPNLVTITHANGVKTTYAHMDAATVKSKQKVKAGQVIGKVCSLGYSTGSGLTDVRRHRRGSSPPGLGDPAFVSPRPGALRGRRSHDRSRVGGCCRRPRGWSHPRPEQSGVSGKRSFSPPHTEQP